MEGDDDIAETGAAPDRIPDTFRNIPTQVDVARRAAEARAAGGLHPRPVS